MNTVALARQLGSRLSVDDPANLPDDAVLDILAAINGGLAEYYHLAPDIYRKTSFRETLRAPEEMTLNFSAKYSNALAGTEFLSRQVGCSVRISDYGLDNRAASTTTLLDDWLGDDLQKPATIYGDAVAIHANIDRITSAVEVRGISSNIPTPLFPSKPVREQSTTGQPRWYWLEPIGINQGGSTTGILRVFPYPDADYIISFDALLAGARQITFADIIDAADVPVASKYAESILVPLCAGQLTASTLWADRNTKTATLNRADEARAKLSILPQTLNPPANRCRTPRGY